LERRKDICPYKEELFKRPDWAGYRNALQEWRKHYKLTAIPKIIPLNNKYGQVFIDNRSDVKNRRKDISTEHLKEIGTKELQKISSTMYDCQKGPPKPPGADIKSWLRKKDPHYMIAGVSTENDYPITYEIAGVANVTPINSDEKFFATLKLDDYTKKVFPSGRENLSISWQEWLQNADESYKQLEEKTDEIMKSVQAIMKSMLPAPFCDSCCSCRQTRKFEEQLQQSKALIDGEKNIHIIDSMQSSGENPTELPINQVPEDEIRTDIIQPIKNVPPCSCVHSIQQMANKDISLSISKENIPWTKEGLCPGMKYRPKEPGAYSCKMYPEDKFCRYPFVKEMTKMERKKIENQKEKEEEAKEKTKFIEAIKEKGDKFISNPDYPAYNNPSDILETAPPAKIIKTDYETTSKLTSSEGPTTSLPLNVQEKQNDIFSKKIKNDILTKKINTKTSLKSPKNVQKGMNKRKKEIQNIKNEKTEPIPLKKIIFNKKDTKLLNTISGSTISKTEKKQQTKSSLHNPIKQSNKISKLTKHDFVKKNREKNIVNETKKIENKQEMARLKNMFKSSGTLGYIQPAVLSEELLAISQRIPEKKTEKIDDEEETRGTKKEPCCWRTKSEQELPAKKTVAYLCEPDYPLETMAVRPGGQLCQCRVTYNISGLVERKTIRKKLNEEDRIIDGILYVTPPISPRRSDEYIPEYDLFKSPYDMCVSEAVDNRLKLLEKYSGPKSLIEKLRKKPKSCNCCNDVVIKEDYLIDQKKDFEETRKKFMESKSPEERWKTALKDTALTDYFTRRDNTSGPCWTTCKKIARSYRPCRLKVVKPVCECKYERKIVERNEERMEWKTRQQRLKNLKKQSFVHIVGISRPVIEDKIIIPDVKKIPREDEKDDVEYCISDVTEDVFMSPPQKIIDGLKMSSPFQTPSSSVEDILRTTVLRHLSPTNIPSCPLSRKDAVLKEEMEHTKKEDEALKIIYKYKDKQDTSYLMIHNYQDELIKKVDKRILNKENHINIKKKTSKEIEGLQSLNKKTDSKIEHRRGVPYKETTGKIIHKNKYSKEIINEIDQQNVSHKQIEKTEEKIDDKSHRMSGGGDKKYKKFDQLIAIMKVELKKMAAEGYIFAKLPKCYLMPQLQDWVMYRQGVVFSETDKKNLMRETRIMWDVTSRKMVMEFEKPSLHMTRHQLKRLTFDQAERLKKKIEKIKEIFYSEVRKARVSYTRMLWSTMKHGKFPSASFKRTFFTYMAGKEADGHVYKPWLPCEIHKQGLNFSCL
ncbi:hypothetical protein G5I_11682, partial [Acromyrmex echinatior]